MIFRYEAGAYDAAMLADGSSLAVGGDEFGWDQFAIVRWKADGSRDENFGFNGKILTRFTGWGSSARALAVRDDETFCVAGIASDGSSTQFALACYSADGTLDSSFGDGGTVLTAVGDWSVSEAIAFQPDGKLIVGKSLLTPPPRLEPRWAGTARRPPRNRDLDRLAVESPACTAYPAHDRSPLRLPSGSGRRRGR